MRGVMTLWMLIGATLGAVLLPSPALAQSDMPPAPYAYRQIPDPKLEKQARALMDELRCLVCQGQSIADSDAPLAGDMRSEVRERMMAGETPDAIRTWLIDRYGNWVTYDPPLAADTIALYLLPVIAMLGGLFLVFRRFSLRGDDLPDEEDGQAAHGGRDT